MSGTGFGKLTLLGDGRYGVEMHDKGLWRAVYVDDCGHWSVTGPPMRTKFEAALYWSEATVLQYFGVAS